MTISAGTDTGGGEGRGAAYPATKAEAIDALLKVRCEYLKWVNWAIARAKKMQDKALAEGRSSIAQEYKLELDVLDDARDVFRRIVDVELVGAQGEALNIRREYPEE